MTDPPAPPHPNFPSHGSVGVSREAFGSEMLFDTLPVGVLPADYNIPICSEIFENVEAAVTQAKKGL